MARVVLDTNVLVSALVRGGKPRKLLLYLLNEHTVITSRCMLAEFADVLSRDKFSIKKTQTSKFLSILIKSCKIVKDQSRFAAVPEDPDDNVILNVAYEGKADYIVTGDRHLLAIERFKQAKIVSIEQIDQILKPNTATPPK